MALTCGAIYIALGYVMNRGNGSETQAFSMLNLAGYNIGTFVIPFAQSFLGPMGVVAVSIFDTGNAVICLGGGYSVASMVKDGGGFSVKRIAKSLGTSVPFIAYTTMLVMNLLHLSVPRFVLSFAEVGSGANAFMAMLMIGVGFKLSADRAQLGSIIKILLLRYSVSIILALIFYFVLPFSVEARQALVILAFSPIGSAVPAFTAELKGDVGLSSATNSISIIISIIIIVSLLSVML
jgi:predicted permease